MISKTFALDQRHSIQGVARTIDSFLRYEEKMDVTRYRREDGSYLVCARAKDGGALRWVGMDRKICASVVSAENGSAVVQIQGGRWRDKGLALCTSLFMLWPLAVTAGMGCVRQACLPKQIMGAVQQYVKHPEAHPFPTY